MLWNGQYSSDFNDFCVILMLQTSFFQWNHQYSLSLHFYFAILFHDLPNSSYGLLHYMASWYAWLIYIYIYILMVLLYSLCYIMSINLRLLNHFCICIILLFTNYRCSRRFMENIFQYQEHIPSCGMLSIVSIRIFYCTWETCNIISSTISDKPCRMSSFDITS